MLKENLFKRVPVSVPHRSGFDKSFRNLFTAKCGTLVPILCDEVIPNSTVHLDLALSAQLPPLASETFMNVDYKVEAFFVPTRILFYGAERWITGNDVSSVSGTNHIRVPVVTATPTNCAAGTLGDYLGVMIGSDTGQGTNVNGLPFLAYHRIWNDWYRSSLVQKDIYQDELEYFDDNGEGTEGVFDPSTSQWCMPMESGNQYVMTSNSYFNDGVAITSLRQRNFGLDYFTMATPSAQNGEVQRVTMALPNVSIIGGNTRVTGASIDASNVLSGTTSTIYNSQLVVPNTSPAERSDISFTVPALRAVNSMQMFLERNNLIGNRLVDYVKGQYGASLKDSIAQRPVYLGSYSFPVYSKGVYQSNQETSHDVASQNPFNSVGARYGHGYAEGSGSLIDFTAEEPGYIMVIGSLVPQVTYSSGIEKYLQRYIERSSQSDMANPILQNVGNQPIYMSELCSAYLINSNWTDRVFGYVERYADWKTRNHQLHGLLRDGNSLASFALQRSFAPPTGSDDQIVISSDFLEIPTNFMDQVSAVDGSISQYGVWVDCYFKYAVSMPLYEYSLPSLQDPAWEHGDVFTIPRGGNKLD